MSKRVSTIDFEFGFKYLFESIKKLFSQYENKKSTIETEELESSKVVDKEVEVNKEVDILT
jgi:hypothetical protein